jgi:hypothetical protein
VYNALPCISARLGLLPPVGFRPRVAGDAQPCGGIRRSTGYSALRGLRGLAAKVEELERKLDTHDKAIVGLLNTLRELMRPPEPPKNRPIGFVIDGE